jgi:hypothetical protein
MAYLPLSTANLPDPAIDPAQGSSPQDYFNTVLWSGNSSSQNIDVGFATDFTWVKCRTNTFSHALYDIIRGDHQRLQSDTTAAESDQSSNDVSFDSEGFNTGSGGAVNASGQTYVAWNWKANGSGVSNTDGSITSTVSANTESGFSIVSYTGTGSATTVGHGLNQAPEFMMLKNRDTTSQWVTWHTGMSGPTYYMYLTTNAEYPYTPFWPSAPTDSVINIGTDQYVNYSGEDYICYCFHSVEGFSKFGSYTGNGNADGTFVYTGFRPAFILIKSSTVSGSAWYLFDEERNIYNPLTFDLYANYSNAESGSSSGRLDMLSNGFKMRSTSADTNSNGATMIYMAFAENPFKYSNAR